MYCAEEFESRGREELIASFLLAYDQSAGGPWSLQPHLWLYKSMSRDLFPFIQARKSGLGQSPCWHVVRHLLRIRDMYNELTEEKAQACELPQEKAQGSVLGQQAIMMFVGRFDEKLQLPSSSTSQKKDPAALASPPHDDNRLDPRLHRIAGER